MCESNEKIGGNPSVVWEKKLKGVLNSLKIGKEENSINCLICSRKFTSPSFPSESSSASEESAPSSSEKEKEEEETCELHHVHHLWLIHQGRNPELKEAINSFLLSIFSAISPDSDQSDFDPSVLFLVSEYLLLCFEVWGAWNIAPLTMDRLYAERTEAPFTVKSVEGFRKWFEWRYQSRLRHDDAQLALVNQIREIRLSHPEISEIEKRVKALREELGSSGVMKELENIQKLIHGVEKALKGFDAFLNGGDTGRKKGKKKQVREKEGEESQQTLEKKAKIMKQKEEKETRLLELKEKESRIQNGELFLQWEKAIEDQKEVYLKTGLQKALETHKKWKGDFQARQTVHKLSGRMFEHACWAEADRIAKKKNCSCVRNLSFDRVHIPSHTTGEFDFAVVEYAEEDSEKPNRVDALLECKRGQLHAVVSDVSKKLKAARFFSGIIPNPKGKYFKSGFFGDREYTPTSFADFHEDEHGIEKVLSSIIYLVLLGGNHRFGTAPHEEEDFAGKRKEKKRYEYDLGIFEADYVIYDALISVDVPFEEGFYEQTLEWVKKNFVLCDEDYERYLRNRRWAESIVSQGNVITFEPLYSPGEFALPRRSGLLR